MTRSEILQVAKPILFNTEMVRAIFDGRKTVTRRVIKPQPEGINDIIYMCNGNWYISPDDCGQSETPVKPPYKPGDYLYVRETWRVLAAHRYEADARIVYRSGGDDLTIRFPFGNTDSINRDEYDRFIEKWYPNGNWHPSLHMPKEAARIFLRVTDVRVERVGDITEQEAHAEGFNSVSDFIYSFLGMYKKCTEESFVWAIKFERMDVTMDERSNWN